MTAEKIPIQEVDGGAHEITVRRSLGNRILSKVGLDLSDEALKNAGVIHTSEAQQAENLARTGASLESPGLSPAIKERAAKLIQNTGGDIQRYSH